MNIAKNPKSTHALWGVEQVYVNQNFSKRVFLKQGLKIKGAVADAVKTWVKIARGSVYHLKFKNEYWAIYAEGLSPIEQSEIEMYFQGLAKNQASLWDWLVPPAHANEVAPSSSGSHPARATISPTNQVADENPASSQGPTRSTWDAMLSCGESFGDGVWDATAGVVEGTFNTIGSAASFLYEGITDPESAYKKASAAFDKSIDFFATIDQKLERLRTLVANLSPQLVTAITCGIAGGAAAGSLIAYLTGGAGGAKFALWLTEAVAKLESLAPFLQGLSGLLSTNSIPNLNELIAKLMKGNLSSERTDLVNYLAESGDSTRAMRAVECAL